MTHALSLVLAVALFAAVNGSAASFLEVLPEQDVDQGGGCVFYLPKGGEKLGFPVLSWTEHDRGVLRSLGTRREFRVRQASSTRRRDERERVGDSTEFRLVGRNVEGLLHATADRVCAVDNESCEATWYKGVLRVQVSGKTTELNLYGGCGW